MAVQEKQKELENLKSTLQSQYSQNLTKAVSDAKAPLSVAISKDEAEITNLKKNEQVMTQQISKVKADLEKQKSEGQKQVETALNQYKSKEKALKLAESQSSQQSKAQIEQQQKIEKAKIATLEAIIKEKKATEDKMASELKNMKNEQQRFAQVVKDTALKAAEKQK